MKNYLLFFATLLTISSCNFISDQETCAEFHLKNELSSTVTLQAIQSVDSLTIFYLDSFTIAPNETLIIHKDCTLGKIDAYPTGNFAKFIFANNTYKMDTLRNLSYSDTKDSVSLYNKKCWTFDNSISHLKVATYTITAKDSLEAR